PYLAQQEQHRLGVRVPVEAAHENDRGSRRSDVVGLEVIDVYPVWNRNGIGMRRERAQSRAVEVGTGEVRGEPPGDSSLVALQPPAFLREVGAPENAALVCGATQQHVGLHVVVSKRRGN